MNEAEWLASTTPLAMLAHLTSGASRHKLRLYACAAGHALWPLLAHEQSRQAVITAEAFADGQASPEELARDWNAAL
jgi:hypothetical protein